MSKIQVDEIVDKLDAGAPTFTKGVSVTGVATATTFSGNLSGNVTGVAVTATSTISVGGTSVNTLIDAKTSPGKAIALSMVFG